MYSGHPGQHFPHGEGEPVPRQWPERVVKTLKFIGNAMRMRVPEIMPLHAAKTAADHARIEAERNAVDPTAEPLSEYEVQTLAVIEDRYKLSAAPPHELPPGTDPTIILGMHEHETNQDPKENL